MDANSAPVSGRHRTAPPSPRQQQAVVGVTAVAVVALLTAVLGVEQVALLLAAVAAAVAAVHPASQRTARGAVHRSGVRRAWLRACRTLALVADDGRVPTVVATRSVPAGDRLRVRLPRGAAADDLAEAAPRLARQLGVQEVRVTPDADDARRATVTLVRRDPLAGAVTVPWPLGTAERASLWEPVPLGVDENGDEVAVALAGRNLLLGGEPLAGKSVALSLALAAAALDPEADLSLLDSKGLEFGVWRDRADHLVGPAPDDAVDVLRGLQRELERRRELLNQRGHRKATRGDGFRLRVVACDELAAFLSGGEGAREVARLLRDLADRGRAVGFVVLAATHRPASLALPAEFRDLFGVRWALRCSSSAAADALLGDGWRAQGFDSVQIGSRQAGVGYLLTDGGPPVRLRAHHLHQAQVRVLAERATALHRAYLALGDDPAA